jgi:hypothetical protein
LSSKYKLHNYLDKNYQAASESFSQIILKETEQVGLGLVQENRGELNLVDNYVFTGNISKSYEKNLLSSMN